MSQEAIYICLILVVLHEIFPSYHHHYSFLFSSYSHHQKKTFLENKRVKKVTDSDFHDCHRSMKMFSLGTPVTALISVPRRQIVFKTISHPLRAAGSFITPVSLSRGQHLVFQNTAMSICAGPSDSGKINLTWE